MFTINVIANLFHFQRDKKLTEFYKLMYYYLNYREKQCQERDKNMWRSVENDFKRLPTLIRKQVDHSWTNKTELHTNINECS
jgi:hypothetical protein